MLENIFYFFNFTYIEYFVSLGNGLVIAKFKNARILIQLFIGIYMLVYLGIISRENMQIVEVFYYISIGVFEDAVIHYLTAY
ncbi:MAG: hypothetical protein FWD40_05660 [Treponema sp.]|nr:hypothetical protein [Treponema sp.]